MDTEEYNSKNRVNPLSLPTETDGRFLLLVTSFLSIVTEVIILTLIKTSFRGNVEEITALVCQNTSNGDFIQRSLLTIIFSVSGVLILTAVLYYLHPSLIIYSKKLKPLVDNKNGNSKFYFFINNIVNETGLASSHLHIFTKNHILSNTAQVFGFFNNQILRVDKGLQILSTKKTDEVSAIIKHELAHVKNKDVGKAYYSEAIWVVSLMCLFGWFGVVIGYRLNILVNGGTIDLYYFLKVAIEISLLFGLVSFVRADFLRIREIYADFRAASWGAESGLRSLFLKSNVDNSFIKKINIFRAHPSPRERLAALENPETKFKFNYLLPFIVGIFLSIALIGIDLYLDYTTGRLALLLKPLQNDVALLRYLASDSLIRSIVSFAVGYFFVATVGMSLVRSIVIKKTVKKNYAKTRLQTYFEYVAIVFILWLGMEAGFLLDIADMYAARNFSDILLSATWFTLLFIPIFFNILYIDFFGNRILCKHTGSKPPTWKIGLLKFLASYGIGGNIVRIMSIRVRFFIIVSARPENITTEFNSGTWLILAIIISYIFIFFFTWLFSLSKIRCPNCGELSRSKFSVGNNCEHCQRPLAKWFLWESTEPQVSTPSNIKEMPLMFFDGINGQINIYQDKIIINRKGIMAKLMQNSGENIIFLHQVKHVEFKPINPLTNGYIRLATDTTKDLKSIFEAPKDSNTVMFGLLKQSQATEMQQLIISLIRNQ